MDTVSLSQREKHNPPSKLFKAYLFRLIFRLVLFVVVLYFFITDDSCISISQNFGLFKGVTLVNAIFVVFVIDLTSKLFPHAPIAMGSRKQHREFHVPTFAIFKNGRKGFVEFIERSFANKKDLARTAQKNAKQALLETKEGTIDTVSGLLHDIGFLRSLRYRKEDLSVSEQLRHDIRNDRAKEIIPVIIFWLVFNIVVFCVLAATHLMVETVLLLWCSFYFLSDMICVVLWCPLQLFLMKNRCCTTCQIFNWDGIMAVTPLFPLFFVSPFAWMLTGLALVVLIRWEAAVARHPERFDERTNMSLQCANCTDKLCYLRAPLVNNKLVKDSAIGRKLQ